MAGIAPERWREARDRSGALAQEWHGHPALTALASAFDDAAADPLIARERAEALLADAGWIAGLLDPLVAALAAEPLIDPPFKVSRDRARLGALLFENRAARVTASVVSAQALVALPPPTTIVATGHVVVTRYHVAGEALVRRWRVTPLTGDLDARRAPPAVEAPSLTPADGAVVVHDGRSEAHSLARATRDVVTITAILRAGAAPVMREYAAADGSFVRAASNDDAGSRSAMLLTLLRVSGRSDAGEVFAAMTHEPAFNLRWSAMREWLALDACAALPRLEAMADADPNIEVRDAANRTLALVEQRLAACPA